MKNSRSNALILGLMIPCLTFLFTSAEAKAQVGKHRFDLTLDNLTHTISQVDVPTGMTVDITNDGPGPLIVEKFRIYIGEREAMVGWTQIATLRAGETKRNIPLDQWFHGNWWPNLVRISTPDPPFNPNASGTYKIK